MNDLGTSNGVAPTRGTDAAAAIDHARYMRSRYAEVEAFALRDTGLAVARQLKLATGMDYEVTVRPVRRTQ